MLLRPAELDAIRLGDIDVAYRRWDRPRLLVGTRMRTSVGLVEATSVEVVDIDGPHLALVTNPTAAWSALTAFMDRDRRDHSPNMNMARPAAMAITW